jgi:DNA-binding NtrC family response regulator
MSDSSTARDRDQTGKILVVDDEPVVCKSCTKVLVPEGYSVTTTVSAREGMAKGTTGDFDVVVVDLKMPRVDGMQILQTIKETQPDVEVIVVTAHSTVSTAVKAMKLGAIDYLPKPFTPDELCVVVNKAIERRKLVAENRYLRGELEEKFGLEEAIGQSRAMRDVYELVKRVGPTNTTVLIYGESGTGKELLAKAVHYNSMRKHRQFIPADCSALASTLLESELFGHVKGSFTGAIATKPGLLELADGGTLFLDEVGNIGFETQGKLLRALEQGEYKMVGGTEYKNVDVRLIAATNKDLEEMTHQGRFRDDLFYRINVFPITLPPLRERKGDIPLLAAHFLKRYRRELGKEIEGFSPELMERLVNADWPGNVRELKNMIERLAITADGNRIELEHLPPSFPPPTGRFPTPEIPETWEGLKRIKKRLRVAAVDRVEKSFLLQALDRNGWNVSKAARETGLLSPNFHALMRKHGIRRQGR